MVEDALGEDQAAHQVRPRLRDQQADGGAHRVPEEVRGTPDHLLEEGRGVLGHLVEGDRPAGIGRPSLTAAVEAVAAKGLREAIEVGIPGAGVGAAGCRRTRAGPSPCDVPPRLDAADFDVPAHEPPARSATTL